MASAAWARSARWPLSRPSTSAQGSSSRAVAAAA
eukprot:CAMPEP_0194686712 /NCGR_PEP_ID=MMETSP0295-20121207/15686_1 /TAXON_ID=39354 /ORGANISM="Heterosigma akashiwo, Strain CCMP2393" /LENGTH=33 /DNA_ID= /DNA_START= /DNA_END= /DNA_ORIENTATION=